MRSAYTLIEMIFVMLLMAVTALGVLPAARRLRDRMAVVGAREAVAGLFAEARVQALLRGGATVSLRSGSRRAWTRSGDSLIRSIDLEREFAVSVSIGRGRDSSDLSYDALGIGRVTSETLIFRRGREEATLVVSGYGRVRRR